MRVDVIEAGFPAVEQRRLRGGERRSRKAIKDSTVCGLARANENDVRRCGEAVQAAPSSPRVHTFIATSPIHMEKKLRMEPAQVIEQAVQVDQLGAANTPTTSSSRPRTRAARTSISCAA